jgi:hypothetical protein
MHHYYLKCPADLADLRRKISVNLRNLREKSFTPAPIIVNALCIFGTKF